ncbi:hypothetical protein KIL84_000555 [Mauremys mutica]|uniref:Uncharacterized protein n=1 Tax=Mauremys mutica TaxID=74926 RepID=A0A9D3WYZ5_9SAUR|nr:hypothetical protein KIL84_000555 [Mauremys mutica]
MPKVWQAQSALLGLQPERDKHTEQNEHRQLTVQISPNYGQPCVPCYILTCLPCECRCPVSETARSRHVTTKCLGVVDCFKKITQGGRLTSRTFEVQLLHPREYF